MTEPTRSTFALPAERAEQFREIIKSMGAPNVSHAIGELIRHYQGGAHAPTHLIGVDVRPFNGKIAITFSGGEHTRLSREGARAMVELIRAYVRGEARGKDFNADHMFAIQRHGNGLKVALSWDLDKAKSFPIDIAADLADLIESKIKS